MGRTKGALNKKTLAKLHQQSVLPAPGELSAFQWPKSAMGFPVIPTLGACDPLQECDPGYNAPNEEPKPAPIFIEYLAPNGEKWRAEQGGALLEMFNLSMENLAAWHGAMAPEERVWRILRWRFGIAPLLAGAADADYLAPIPVEQIAAKLGVDLTAIGCELESAKAFWVRWQMANRRDDGGSRIEDGGAEGIQRATPTEREALLKLHGFSDLRDEEEELYAFTRIGDLKHKLEDEEGRTIAQSCIRVELRIRRNNQIMAKIERQAADPGTSPEQATSLRADIKGYHDMAGDLARQHLDLMKAMNATQEQNPSVQRKVAFVDCLGQLTRAMQEYESRGDTTLIDGIFTAAEVKILTTPMSLRPPQYRLDIVMIARHAMEHENLWNPEYEPVTAERGMYRRMRAALQAVLTAAENETGTMVEMEDDEAGLSGAEDVIAEVPSALPANSPPNGSAPPGVAVPANRGARRVGDDFVTA